MRKLSWFQTGGRLTNRSPRAEWEKTPNFLGACPVHALSLGWAYNTMRYTDYPEHLVWTWKLVNRGQLSNGPYKTIFLSLREKRPLLWFCNVCGFTSLWAGTTFSKFAVCYLNVEFCLDKEILPKSKDLVPALLQMWMGNKTTKTTEKVNRWINNVTIDPQTGGSP